MDIQIFTSLKEQVIEVFTFLLVMRDFAAGRGLQKYVDQIDSALAENAYIQALANDQLAELNRVEVPGRLGLFDTV